GTDHVRDQQSTAKTAHDRGDHGSRAYETSRRGAHVRAPFLLKTRGADGCSGAPGAGHSPVPLQNPASWLWGPMNMAVAKPALRLNCTRRGKAAGTGLMSLLNDTGPSQAISILLVEDDAP